MIPKSVSNSNLPNYIFNSSSIYVTYSSIHPFIHSREIHLAGLDARSLLSIGYLVVSKIDTPIRTCEERNHLLTESIHFPLCPTSVNGITN